MASTESANLVLVGDVDILSDRLWVQAQNFLGQRLVTAFANNGDFVINALDNLSGSAALIGLRSRATYTRPFTRVDELRRNADLEFRATEDRLEAELTQTEQRLGELQAARSDGNSLLMSPEQQAEVQRFLDQQVRIRQELRAVRRNLDADIETLGTWLKAINIALVPIVLTIIALGVGRGSAAQEGAAMSRRDCSVPRGGARRAARARRSRPAQPHGTDRQRRRARSGPRGGARRHRARDHRQGERRDRRDARESAPTAGSSPTSTATPRTRAKLRQALTALGEARILEQKTANPELYGRLGVEDVAARRRRRHQRRVRRRPAASCRPSSSATPREPGIGTRAAPARHRAILIDRNPDVPRATAQWVDSVIIDVRGERVRDVTITHADGEVVRLSKTGAELANFDVADVPSGRELSYPGVANVVGNALRELNLEDVEPADASPAEPPTIVEYRTFDGLVVRSDGHRAQRRELDRARGERRREPGAGRGGARRSRRRRRCGTAEGAAAPAADPSAEAARINAKVGGWRYKIAGFQYDQMTRRMADLLKRTAGRPDPARSVA